MGFPDGLYGLFCARQVWLAKGDAGIGQVITVLVGGQRRGLGRARKAFALLLAPQKRRVFLLQVQRLLAPCVASLRCGGWVF